MAVAGVAKAEKGTIGGINLRPKRVVEDKALAGLYRARKIYVDGEAVPSNVDGGLNYVLPRQKTMSIMEQLLSCSCSAYLHRARLTSQVPRHADAETTNG